jgi:hypothetical protein
MGVGGESHASAILPAGKNTDTNLMQSKYLLSFDKKYVPPPKSQ